MIVDGSVPAVSTRRSVSFKVLLDTLCTLSQVAADQWMCRPTWCPRVKAMWRLRAPAPSESCRHRERQKWRHITTCVVVSTTSSHSRDWMTSSWWPPTTSPKDELSGVHILSLMCTATAYTLVSSIDAITIFTLGFKIGIGSPSKLQKINWPCNLKVLIFSYARQYFSFVINISYKGQRKLCFRSTAPRN